MKIIVVRRFRDRALAGGTQWIDRGPVSQRVTGSIPSQGTRLGYRTGPQWGVCKSQPHVVVAFLLFPSLLLCLKIDKIFFKKIFIKRRFRDRNMVLYPIKDSILPVHCGLVVLRDLR